MKKSLLIFFLLLSGVSSQSQVLITLLFGNKLNTTDLEFGLEGGGNWSKISGLGANSFEPNWNLGFYFDIRIKKQWFIYTGVLVKASLGVNKLTAADLNLLGATVYFEKGDYAQKMNYFLVPALIKYKFKSRIFIEGGLQFGLMYKSWIEYVIDFDGKEGIIKEFNKDQLNKIDVGAMGGAGYRFSSRLTSWSLGVKYYYGFVDVYKDISNTKNSSIFLKLNIPIGAGEKAKAKNAKKAEEKKAKKEEKAANKEAKENNEE
jgi:hypothetical protein